MAVIHAPDDILRKHGLKTDGDIIRLRILCREDNLLEKKKELKQILVDGTSS